MDCPGNMMEERQVHYQELFTAVLLQQAHQAQLSPGQRQEAAPGRVLQAGMAVRDALVREMLQAGTDTAALQAALAGCATAVLRLGQALHGPAQQQVVQDALQAMQEAELAILHGTRDQQLLQLVRGSVAADAPLQQQQQQQRQQEASSSNDSLGWPQGLAWLQQCPQAADVWSAAAGMVDCSSHRPP